MLEDSFLQNLEAYRQTLGLHLCLKVLRPSQAAGTALERAAGSLSLHRSRFCESVKRVANARCRECDLRKVPAQCQRERKPFWHTCHAGASEIIIPVFADNNLTAVAYLGQFRQSPRQPAELPLKSVEERKKLIRIAVILGHYLHQGLNMPVFSRPSSQEFRRQAIGSFLRKNLRVQPDLPALAKHLGLSASRAGHAVREATGSGFAELRAGLRREHAKDLLTGTYYKISQVAEECGFSSPEYFHRFFRKETGLTPSEYRTRHRPEA